MDVLIIDDHEVIWSGMGTVLERLPQRPSSERMASVVGRKSVEAALELAGRNFDLILLDYHLPGASGLAALAQVRQVFEAAPVVVLSADKDPRQVREIISAGAAGFVSKAMSPTEMIGVLGLVLAHGVYLPPAAFLEFDPGAPLDEPDLPNEAIEEFLCKEFSPRQRQVFARALRGKPNKVIARELGIAEGTVKVHLAMVFRALGVRNRTEAMYRVLSADAAGAIEKL